MGTIILGISCLFVLVQGEIIIPSPHPFAGTYPISRFRSFGWIELSNIPMTLSVVTDVNIAGALCANNHSAVSHLRGKLVGLIYPYFTSIDPLQSIARGGCAPERMFSVAMDAGIAGMALFQNPETSGWSQLIWSRCRNCSIFSGRAIDMPCIFINVVPGTTKAPWTQVWIDYVQQGTMASMEIADSNVTLVKMDKGPYEGYAITVGIVFQSIFALWALSNVIMAAVYISFQAQVKPHPVLALAALSLELVCNLWRFSFFLVDPWLMNSILPIPYWEVIGSCVYSVSCVATWLIACFWVQLTLLWKFGPGYRHSKRARFGIPLLIVSGSLIILSMEFVPRTMAIFGDALPYRASVQVFFFCQFSVHFALAVFLLASGLRVLWMKADAGEFRVGLDDQARSIARFIVVDATLLLAVAGYSAILYAESIFYPDYWLASRIGLASLYLALSTSQILTFRRHAPAPHATDSSLFGWSGSSDLSHAIDTLKVQVHRFCCCVVYVKADPAPGDDEEAVDYEASIERQLSKSARAI